MHYALKNRYPIETDRQVKTACAYFKKNLSRFSPNDRVGAACNIEKRAAELSVPLSEDWVTNYSRAMKPGAGYSPDFNRSMGMRKTACETHRVQVQVGDKKVNGHEVIENLTKQASELQPLEVFRALQEFDKLANLEHHYDSIVPDPYMTVFGGYTAPEYDAVKVAGDVTDYELVRHSRTANSLEKIAQTMGKSFSTSFAKNPIAAIEGLNAIEKATVDNTLNSKE